MHVPYQVLGVFLFLRWPEPGAFHCEVSRGCALGMGMSVMYDARHVVDGGWGTSMLVGTVAGPGVCISRVAFRVVTHTGSRGAFVDVFKFPSENCPVMHLAVGRMAVNAH